MYRSQAVIGQSLERLACTYTSQDVIGQSLGVTYIVHKPSCDWSRPYTHTHQAVIGHDTESGRANIVGENKQNMHYTHRYI
jgi:hypothetical protein